MYYNNPSFGSGGYCLPKDTKQLLANYLEKDIPHHLIKATIESNIERKFHIAQMIIKRNPSIVGIYRLTMKSGSDNFRSAAIIDIIEYLKVKDVKMIIYEPYWQGKDFMGIEVENNLDKFKERANLIVANRLSDEIKDVLYKVYTGDVFGND